MSIYWLFIYIPCMFVMFLSIRKLLKRNAGLASSNDRLLRQNTELLNYIEAIQNTMLGRSKPTPLATKPSKGRIIDDTTAKLIRLAMNNPSSNEASNAAIQVCNRLSKKLK